MRKSLVACLVVAALALACGSSFAEAAPSIQVGVVAQRYPWNGMVDVTVKTTGASDGAQLVVKANGVEVVRQAAVNGEQKVSFDANKVEALKGKQIKDVKVTAHVEPAK